MSSVVCNDDIKAVFTNTLSLSLSLSHAALKIYKYSG